MRRSLASAPTSWIVAPDNCVVAVRRFPCDRRPGRCCVTWWTTAEARNTIFLLRNGEARWPNGTLSGRYRFRHPLYQRVLYDELAPAARYASQQHSSSDALVHLHRALSLQKDSGGEGEAAIPTELASTLPAVEGLTGGEFAALFARARSLNAGSADVLEAVVTLAGLLSRRRW